MPATSPLIKRTLVQGPIHTPRPLDSRPVVLGRLVSLSSTFNGVKDYLSQTGDASSSVVINFPSMPETLDLGRRADYLQTTAPYTPDGIHLYKKTMPLEIPISFSLHSKDPFCSKGGLSLLIMAAKLHSLVLPMNRDASRSRISVTVGNYYGAASSGQGGSGKAPSKPKDSSSAGTPEGQTQESIAFNGDTGQATTVFPPACLLDLISVGDRDGAPGVRCVGYISEVGVKLKGPWLRGQQVYGQNGIRNVPTSGDFSFKFVHAPGFSNYFGGALTSPFQLSGLSAFADDVLENFYNTLPLTQGQEVTNRYIGFGENPNLLNSNAVNNGTPPPTR
jgi:hypothetical protein